MAKYCGKCGSLLDVTTGKCPVCDKTVFQEEAIKHDDHDCFRENQINNGKDASQASYSQQIPGQNTTQSATSYAQFSDGMQPPVTSNYAASQTQTVTRPVKSKNIAARIIITCLLWILFFAFFIGLTAVIHVRNLISSGGISAIIENVKIEDALEGFDDLDIKDFYNEVKENLENAFGVTPTDKQIESLIKDTTIKDFISDKLGDAAEALLEGEEAEVRINKEEIDKILRENKNEIEKILGTSISSDDIKSVTEKIFDESDELYVISTRELTDRVPAAFYAVRFGLSYIAVAILTVLCLIVFVIMSFTNFRLTSWLCGITLALVGASCIIFSAFGGLNLFRHGSNIYKISLLIKSVFTASLTYSIIVTVIGVSLIVSAIVSHIVKKTRQNNYTCQ